MIVGVDEVGRGCWAGPLCVGAVILGDVPIVGLDDSKKLSPKRREELAAEIRLTARAIGVGWVSAAAIDRHGLSAALTAATKQAISQILIPFEEIIIDGTVNFIGDKRVTTLAKADSLVPAVSAASIVAKVARDQYMRAVHSCFSQYRFDSHVGYGTAMHRRLLAEHGPSPLHRLSYAPFGKFDAEILQTLARQRKTVPKNIGGKIAEAKAVAFLQAEGYEIVQQNWRTRWCEIDIVAKRGDAITFVEVKYRQSPAQGSGLDYITAKKRGQMKFAAEFWTHQHKWAGDMRLAALEVSGSEFMVTAWLDTL